MFHADSRGPWIDRWRFDREAARSPIASASQRLTRSDGPTAEAATRRAIYWSAGVSAGRLNRFAPDGSLPNRFELPVPAPTMPCFGGADFRTLYVTSLTEGRAPALLAKRPAAGGLFAAQGAGRRFPSLAVP